MEKSVILAAMRTPIGSFQGALKSLSATQLGGIAIKAAVARSGIDPSMIDEVIMGCVLSAGLGQSPARQAAINAGIPLQVGSLTVNRVCSSGLKSVMIADSMIRAGEGHLFIAGGMESMTNAPYCIPGARSGLRMGDAKIVDTMVHDGLWDIHSGQHMGSCAEMCAKEHMFTREQQDDFAQQSYTRAQQAMARGAFKDEIVPVEIRGKKGDVATIDSDEEPQRANFEKMKALKPSFVEGGTITAANASSISDAAAALVVASESYAQDRGLVPMARIIAQAGHSHEPEWFTTAPIGAIRRVLDKTGLKPGDIDLWEINEAFACVTMAAAKTFGLNMAHVNVNGGAVALGHPIGSSGARILVTLVHAMRARGAKRGLATLCNGGGEATAVIIELMK